MLWHKMIKEKFDDLAKDYDRAFFAGTARTSTKRFEIIKSLAKYVIPVNSSNKILEIGSGTGMYTRLLAAFYQRSLLVSTDLSGHMLEQAASRLKTSPVKFVQSNAEALPFLKESFDAVFSFSCLHHIKNSEHVFAETQRVLKEGGHFFLMEPNPLNPVNVFLGLIKPHERGMLWSYPSKWIKQARQSALTLVALKSGSFFPSWPQCCWAIYDKVEPALEDFWLTKKCALFYYYAFKKGINRPGKT